MNILYAEDDLITRQAVLFSLSAIDFISNIDVAQDGQEAINLYNSNKNYDVILTDINMPGKDGLEFINEISERNNLYTVVFTAYDDSKYLLKSIDLQVSKYLIKPLKINELKETLLHALEFKAKQENKKQKEQVALQNARYNASNELLENLAHHWRQYLSVINIEASAIKYLSSDNQTLDEQHHSLDNIIQTVSNLSQLLDKFKFEKEFTEESINLEKFIYTLIDEKKEMFDTKGIKVKKSLVENLTIKSQIFYLDNMITCILQNSIEQFERNNIEDKIISIKTVEKENEIDILIKDNAGGISKDIMDKIFEPYTTTKFQSKDIGLSLYICKSIVTNLLKGNIDAKNIDDGALFTISLPK